VDLRRLRTRLSEALFELAVRLAPSVPAPMLAAPELTAAPWGGVTVTHLKAEPEAAVAPPAPELVYVADPAKQRIAATLRMLAHDVEIGVASRFQAVWHGGPCPMHVVAHLPPSAGDA